MEHHETHNITVHSLKTRNGREYVVGMNCHYITCVHLGIFDVHGAEPGNDTIIRVRAPMVVRYSCQHP